MWCFSNADKGMLVQDLPFSVELKKFHIDFYNTGMPKDFRQRFGGNR